MFFEVTEASGTSRGRLFTAHERSTLDAPCTWASALKQLQHGGAGAEISEELATVPFSDYYWECRPVSWSRIDEQQFEFVVLDASGSLNGSPASSTSFAEHLKATSASVVSFPNLGKDAVLVVPDQVSGVNSDAYGHLATFIRQAPEDQKENFWRLVSEVMVSSLKASAPSPVWLSTAGNGVPWVHVRADSWPKYIKHEAFRSFDSVCDVSDGHKQRSRDELSSEEVSEGDRHS